MSARRGPFAIGPANQHLLRSGPNASAQKRTPLAVSAPSPLDATGRVSESYW